MEPVMPISNDRALTPFAAGLALLTLLGAATPAAAQMIGGHVREAGSSAPIAGAEVALLDTLDQAVATTESDETGYFILDAKVAGVYRLRATRIGYTSVTAPPVHLLENRYASVELRLATDAVPISPLTVIARPGAFERDMAGFHMRMREGFGHFITPEEIKRHHQALATSYVGATPGVVVLHAHGRGIVTMRGQGTTRCLPIILLDGAPIPLDNQRSLDDLIPAGDVYAIEVYNNPRQVPQWVGSYMTRVGEGSRTMTTGCGAILVWTDRRPQAEKP